MFRFFSLRRILVLAGTLAALAATVGFSQPKQEVQATASSAYRGVLVLSVESGGPAAAAGVARGDVILSVGGTDVNSSAELSRAVQSHKSGDTVSLRFLHGDVERTIQVTLGNRDGLAYLGISVEPQATGTQPAQNPSAQLPRFRSFRWYGYPGSGRGGFLGAWIASVVADSPAAKAGLKAGDLIEAVDGVGIDTGHSLASLIGQKKPADQVALIVRASDDTVKTITLALGENPNAKGQAWLGIQYSTLPGFAMMAPGAQVVPAGVLVDDVVADSAAAKASIKPGDVITAIAGVRVRSPQDVIDAVGKHKPGDSLTLTVWSPATSQQTDVTLALGENPNAKGQAYLGVQLSRAGRSGARSFFGVPYNAPGFPQPMPRGMPRYRYRWPNPDVQPPAPQQTTPATPATPSAEA